MNGVTLGQYVASTSFVHRLDPRTKLIAVFLYMLYLLWAQHLYAYLLLTTTLLVSIWASNLPILLYWRALKPIFFFILVTILLHLLWTTGGEIVLQLPGLTIYEAGVWQAGSISLRLLLLVLAASLLSFTTSPLDLTYALEELLRPLKKLKVPVHELVFMMSIALRFIPTLAKEAEKIKRAQMARGADFESGWFWRRLKSYIPVFIPLIVSAFRRAEVLAMAMEARCYRGGEKRTRWRQYSLQMRDGIIVTLFLILGLGVWWLRK